MCYADELIPMHIPDGYLSPATCAALYATSAPFWYVALRRLKRLLTTRLIPLLSVFAAFSFLVMMFNLPLPGGTTGHALGVAIASIVRPVGFHPRHFDCSADPSSLLRGRWRHHAGGQLL